MDFCLACLQIKHRQRFLGFFYVCICACWYLVSFLQLTRSSQRVTHRAAKMRAWHGEIPTTCLFLSFLCLQRCSLGEYLSSTLVLKLWKSDNEEMLCSARARITRYASQPSVLFSKRSVFFNVMNVCLRIMMRSRHVLCLWQCARVYLFEHLCLKSEQSCMTASIYLPLVMEYSN